MTFSVLIVVAGLGPLIILWGLFFWVSFVVVSCFKVRQAASYMVPRRVGFLGCASACVPAVQCCCCTSSPKEDALELMEHAAPPPHAPESEIPSGPPPAYRSVLWPLGWRAALARTLELHRRVPVCCSYTVWCRAP